jgi:hypothetical protein
MPGAAYYFNPSVPQFAAHVFCHEFEFVVIFADDAKDGDFELSKQFVNRRLDAWTGGAQCICKAYRTVVDTLFSNPLSNVRRECSLTVKQWLTLPTFRKYFQAFLGDDVSQRGISSLSSRPCAGRDKPW